MWHVIQLSRNAKKYCGCGIPIDEKKAEKIIMETIGLLQKNAVKNGVLCNYLGNNDIKIKGLTNAELEVGLRFLNDEDIGGDGRYNEKDNVIELSRSLLYYPRALYESVVHEFRHRLQYAMADHINDYKKGSNEHRFLSLIAESMQNNQSDENIFGIKFSGRPTVNCFMSVGDLGLNQIHWMFYKLSVAERDALLAAKSYGDDFEKYCLPRVIQNTMAPAHCQYDEMFDEFRKEFCCNNLSKQDVLRVIDAAQECALNKISPSNDLEATVAYSLASTLSWYSETINDQEYLKITDYDQLEKTLRAHGYRASWETANLNDMVIYDDLDMTQYDELLSIRSLPARTRVNNPSLLLYAVVQHKEDAISVVPNMEALKEWCQSENNHFPYEFMKDVVDVLGIEFLQDKYKLRWLQEQAVVGSDWNKHGDLIVHN